MHYIIVISTIVNAIDIIAEYKPLPCVVVATDNCDVFLGVGNGVGCFEAAGFAVH